MPKHTIIIRRESDLSLRKTLTTAAAQIGVIGIGIIADSPAMQWSGFALLALLAIGITLKTRAHPMTFAEARREIARLEVETD